MHIAQRGHHSAPEKTIIGSVTVLIRRNQSGATGAPLEIESYIRPGANHSPLIPTYIPRPSDEMEIALIAFPSAFFFFSP